MLFYNEIFLDNIFFLVIFICLPFQSCPLLSPKRTMQGVLSPGNTKGRSITVPLTSCLTGLDWSVLKIKTTIVSCHTADSKPVIQEVKSTVMFPPLVFPGCPIKAAFTLAKFWQKKSAIFVMQFCHSNCIGHLDTNKIISLCIVSPKVIKASRVYSRESLLKGKAQYD